ncbi:MAG: protein kinase, partial [Alphaproteobacteria bacterium]|nr:protein kinase [Alphaproteobacteria bacterium]
MNKYLQVNMSFKDKYQIKSVMGENPLGITYAGVDTTAGRKIIIREFFPSGLCNRNEDTLQITGGEEYNKRKGQFIKESGILKENSGLKGIVDIFDVFEENGTVYIIMEYVEGVSLEKYLTGSGKQFPLKRIMELMDPVIDSLLVLHEKGLVHQNISPDNIIFTNQGNLKLIGFGCMEGQISDASVGYAPIELYRKQQEIKPGTDVYSLCAAIYRCVTGVRPQDAYERLTNDTLQKPSLLGIVMDSSEETALMMGLNIYEEKRLRTIMAFKKVFYSQKTQEDISARQPQPPVQPQPSVQPQPYPDMRGEIVSPNAGKKGKTKESKGNGGMIALIVIGIIVIIALGVSAVILGRSLFLGDSVEVNQELEEESTESETEIATEEETENSYAEYETMLVNRDFSGVIDSILILNTVNATAEEKDALSKIMEQAIAGQYSDFESRINSSQNSGDYEGAFVIIDEEIVLYDRLNANALATQYVDKQKIENKRVAVKNAHINYLLNERLNKAVNQGDETILNEILIKLQEYVNEGAITQEDFDTKKTSAYARFVVEKISAMNNSGIDPTTILNYIDSNLLNTGNNCQVLEFWDYFNVLVGGIRMDATVRHVSSNGYLLEYSNSMNLATSDISHLSQYEIRLAIYEIFARHGRTFSDEAINDYFALYSW